MARKYRRSRSRFDVIMMSDFRLPGGTTSSNIEEMKAQKRAGLTTGLYQMSGHPNSKAKRLNPKIRRMIDGTRIRLLRPAARASCKTLIIRHPRILHVRRRLKPRISAQKIHIIINQTPKKDYGGNGQTVYRIGRCQRRVKQYFGKTGIWHPIGPQVRKTLQQYHARELRSIRLAAEDWVNIINTREWKRKRRPAKNGVIRIGRHSRDAYVKWPSNRTDLLAIYPSSSKYEIHVLGGARTPRKILGKLPNNWHVLPFGARAPKSFLEKLDVFVYYTHPDCVEAFGRVIFEAMAAQVPVILPPSYKELFGEAAIYARPAEVQGKIDALMADSNYYEKQIERATRYVETHFGYTKHRARLK
ncbi:glycosyltransferase [Paenibacillus luteus]|uniref:glycosyltransferase n=1 Tax=Paenibacillus luteus TaxID=2545753 RepID=UPI0011440456|nr:glycosyltransferase [Paenibacillus luteus]